MPNEMNRPRIIRAAPLNRVHEHLGAVYDGARRGRGDEDELAVSTPLHEAAGKRLFDMHEIVEAAESREPEQTGNQDDVMPGACHELRSGTLAPVADLKNATDTARLQTKLHFLGVRKLALVQVDAVLSEPLDLGCEIANVPG